MSLKNDYKDYSFTDSRKYKITNNSDGTVSIQDVTDYEEIGDSFGAADINAITSMINLNEELLKKTVYSSKNNEELSDTFGNVLNPKISRYENIKTSSLDNDLGFISRADEYLSFASLDAFKTYITDNLKSSRAYLISLSINGQGQAAIVQKTSNLYASFILFGYATAPVLWKCSNGVWTSVNL